MNAPARQFPVETDPKGPYPLLIGLEGPPGGGKTLSALRLAAGIQRVRKGPIRLIDTEARRSAAYRAQIEFGLVGLDPPFRPGRFLAAVREIIEHDNPACVIVDSLSDEHEGEGGVLEWHEEEVSKRLGDRKNDWAARAAMGQAGWIVPKADRTRMINGFLRITTPLIFTFRAREKTKPIEKNGKVVPTKIGYQAIAPAEICHAMTCMCLIPAHAEGKAKWRSEEAGEDFLLKRPNFLAHILKDAQLDESTGEKLAVWASGKTIPRNAAQPDPPEAPPSSPSPPGETDEARLIRIDRELSAAAIDGMAALQRAWKSIPKKDQGLHKRSLDVRHKPAAEASDKARNDGQAEAR